METDTKKQTKEVKKMYGVYNNGNLKGKYTSENKAFMGLQRLQPFSASHAIRHEGWSIRKIPRKKRR